MTKTLLLIVITLTTFTSSYAKDSKKAAPHKTQKQTKAKETLLYEQWYQIIVDKKNKVAYYSDQVVQIGDKIQFKHSIWKNEEGFINREVLSAFSEDNQNLTPVFFNLFQKYRNNETTIDGTIQNGTSLKLNIKNTNEKSKLIEKSVRKDSIFSLFFPLWLAKRIDQFNGNTPLSVYVIIEDAKNETPTQETSMATLVPQDDFAKKTDTYKFIIKFLGQQSTWWIKKNGLVEKISMPNKNAEVIKVSAAEAQKTFLNND